MSAGIEAIDNGVHDAGGTVDDIERWMELMIMHLPRGDMCRILVGSPAGVYGIHVDAMGVIVGGRGACHHVQRCLCHVSMGMARGFEATVKLAFHSGDRSEERRVGKEC